MCWFNKHFISSFEPVEVPHSRISKTFSSIENKTNDKLKKNMLLCQTFISPLYTITELFEWKILWRGTRTLRHQLYYFTNSYGNINSSLYCSVHKSIVYNGACLLYTSLKRKRLQVNYPFPITDLHPVSYTHLDVYKRQLHTRTRYMYYPNFLFVFCFLEDNNWMTHAKLPVPGDGNYIYVRKNVDICIKIYV